SRYHQPSATPSKRRQSNPHNNYPQGGLQTPLTMIPIHINLARSLASTPDDRDTFVISTRGKAYTLDSFGMWFKKKCVEAGIKDRTMHGLRKAAARRMAECGLSNQMIKSITGHTNDNEVAHYTAAADQKKMAMKAMEILNLANHSA
ncbi:MAG: hypothetical protein E2598_08555, partial [Sphingobium sp.]|nr:hypothetical protein [Sphingobium sp.]